MAENLYDELMSTGIVDILGLVMIISGVVASLSVLGPISEIPVKDIPFPLAVIMVLVGLVFIAEGQVGDTIKSRQAVLSGVGSEEDEEEDG